MLFMSYKPRHAKPSATKRRVAVAATSGAAVAGLLANPALANAQPAPAQPAAQGDVLGQIDQNIRQNAWDARNNLTDQANLLPPDAAAAARGMVDGAINGLFPGLIQEMGSAAQAPVQADTHAGTAENNSFDRGSCPREARVCIDLDGERSWLQSNGEVAYGAVPISSGAPGWETPRGRFYVNRKVKDEVSREFHNAPMPYSVYFTNNGIAMHEGRIDWYSHGCVHLNHDAAVTYFNELKPGDLVYVY